MDKDTETLLSEIASAEDFLGFAEENEGEFTNESARDFLNRKLAARGLTIAEAAAGSGHRSYLYKVFDGSRRPSRDILICAALALRLSAGETRQLMRLAGAAPLDPRIRRDAAAIYAITHGLGERKLNEMLFEIGEREV